MKPGLRLVAGCAAALLLLSVAASAALGYQGQVAFQVSVAGPGGTLHCATNITVTATVLDSGGIPVDNRAVVWTFGAGQVAGDHIVTSPTMTNASGVATTTVVLACVAGNRTIIATADPASAQTVLAINSGGLPPTGTDGQPTPAWPYGLAALGLLGAVLIVGRRVRQGR